MNWLTSIFEKETLKTEALTGLDLSDYRLTLAKQRSHI